MRGVVAVVASAALLLALNSALGRAAALAAETQRFDLGPRLMLVLFGETSDAGASYAAARGDQTSESPLRDLVLQVRPQRGTPHSPGAVADFAQDRLPLSDLAVDQGGFAGSGPFDASPSVIHFSAPPMNEETDGLLTPAAHFTVAYQPVPPQPAISPEPGTLAFAPPQMLSMDSLSGVTHVGSVRFEGSTQGAQSQPAQLTLPDASYDGGANFNIRAGKRNLSVNLSSAYEHTSANSGDAFSASTLGSDPPWQLPSVTTLGVPNDSGLNRLSLGAGLSVPVVHGLTLNLKYDAQRLYGEYSVPGLVNLDTVNNTYGGNLTFNIPQSSSSLSIGAYQDRFQDGILPVGGQNQTREDVNFTVKF